MSDALLQEAFDDVFEAERLEAFQQQLGISTAEEEDFGWIAEVGLQSPLPPRWTSHTDDGSGYVYYVDHDRQVSSWENPLVPYLRRVVEIGRSYLMNPTDAFFEDQKGLLWHEHKHELDCWNGPFTDPEGRPYFINAAANVSSWQDPRIDAQYIFELESGLITSLQEVVLPPVDPDMPGFGDTLDGASAWRSAGGADVLTLDGSRPGTGFRKRPASMRRAQSQVLGAQARQTAKQEHHSTLETMGAAADKLRDLQEDDTETQRFVLARKADQRRKRLQAKKAVAQNPSPGSLAGRRAPPALAAVLEDDEPVPAASPVGGPKPPASDLPPPPPPGEAAVLQSGGEELGPPVQAPSPTAGKKIELAPELQHRLESSRKRNKHKERTRQSSFTNLELKAAPESPMMQKGTQDDDLLPP